MDAQKNALVRDEFSMFRFFLFSSRPLITVAVENAKKYYRILLYVENNRQICTTETAKSCRR